MQKRERTSHCPVPGCDYLGYSVHGVQTHVRYHHPSYAPTDGDLYPCPVCDEERTGLRGLMTHLDQAHAFEDFPNPVADERLAEGIRNHLAYADKLREFERRYPEAA